jgi:hypothetical protein
MEAVEDHISHLILVSQYYEPGSLKSNPQGVISLRQFFAAMKRNRTDALILDLNQTISDLPKDYQ